MPHSSLSCTQQCLLIGGSTSDLLKARFSFQDRSLALITHPDTTSETALSELFSNCSPVRHSQGHTLFLECFANDVILARHSSPSLDDQLRNFSLLCYYLSTSRPFKRVVLIDLWPAVLKSDSLSGFTAQIARERNLIAAALSSVVEFEAIELGRDSSSLANPADLFNLNAQGLDSLEACLRERLPSSSVSHHGWSVSARLSDDVLPATLPLLYLNAAKITALFPPDQALNTYSSNSGADVFLAAPFSVEVSLAEGANRISLLSISYLETTCTSYLSIRNSTCHFFVDVSSGFSSPGKRFVLMPHGSVRIGQNDPLTIQSCLQPPPGAEQILGVEQVLRGAAIQMNRTDSADSISGLFGLTFDADVSRISAQARQPTNVQLSASHQFKLAPRLSEIRLFPMGMWPGYDVSDHGCFQGLPGIKVSQVDSINQADAILVGVFSDFHDLDRHYQEIISLTSKPLIFYTNEHSSEGVLPGIRQLDFDRYFACLSHYRVSHPAHVWSPMAVNWFGWDCVDLATGYFRQSLSRNPLRDRERQALFCYSNDCCDHRNQTAELLLSAGLLHSCGRLLNNCEGKTVSGSRQDCLDYFSRFAGYLAFENSSFPGYFTEKAMQGIMAGCKTFYWGDSTASDLFSEHWLVDLTGLSAFECASVIARYLVTVDDTPIPEEPFKPFFKDLLLASRDSLCRILLSLK